MTCCLHVLKIRKRLTDNFYGFHNLVLHYSPHTCERKSHRICQANSHKIFQISQNFQNILQHILWRNNHKSHFVVFITSFLHLNKGIWLFWGSFKVIFIKFSQNLIKSHLKICLISQISVHSLWHVCTIYFKSHKIGGNMSSSGTPTDLMKWRFLAVLKSDRIKMIKFLVSICRNNKMLQNTKGGLPQLRQMSLNQSQSST